MEGVFYANTIEIKLVNYIGSDWERDVETRKGISGYSFRLNNSTIHNFPKNTSC